MSVEHFTGPGGSTSVARVAACIPRPQLVWHNDWRQVDVPALEKFVPELPVSVIVPYCAQPEELERLLAALEGQTYPRELFEVVVVDDGSPQPLAHPRSTPLDVKVVRQEDQGFTLARTRNTGVRAAAHDVLLFLDADMLPEADWLAAHVRWHHVVPDALTLASWGRIPVDSVDAGTIRNRTETLRELLEGREADWIEDQWIRSHLHRTADLTSKADDLFRVVAGGNLGVRRGFFELVGGFDESFRQWGGEDTEFGYRAFTRGGLLIPAPDAFAWHQGLWKEGRTEKERSMELQRAKLAHLIAHPGFRSGPEGRVFTVPQYVVTIEGGHLPAERLLEAVEQALSGPMHDLVVRLELPEDHVDREWLKRHLGPDPRVRPMPSRTALEEFPASPFHVTLPAAGEALHADVVERLRARLGAAVIGRSVFADGSRASITRAWALHRALRTPWEAFDFGDVVTIPPRKLRPSVGGALYRALRMRWRRLGAELGRVDGPVAAWRFVRWFTGAIRRRVLRRSGGAALRPGRSGRLGNAGRPGNVPKVKAQPAAPPPRLVWYNDWRQVDVPALGEFVPELPVSVIVPYFAQAEELARMLAALEVQTYPRELFEVVVVDDGSPEPLARPRSTPLDVKVVRQEHLGFGAARARNTGARSALHDVLLFLDADMLPEADWLAAHARWHHVVPDALTLGLRAHVSVDGVDAETIRRRPGTLKELFKGRGMDSAWYEPYWTRTNDLTLKADDVFRVVVSANSGVRRGLFELAGGFDESFTRWGCEDMELGYRTLTRGGLLVPVRDAFAWHQGRWQEGRAKRKRSVEWRQAKLSRLIAHPFFRTGLEGRTFTVPQYVVTIEGGRLPAERLLEAVERVLSGPINDLVVRLKLALDHPRREWLKRYLAPDPRVRVAPSRSALEEFPVSPFHVALPAERPLHADVVRRLRAGLGTAVIGRSVLPDGARASITRAWALHRALRTPWEAIDFGDVVTIPPRKLRPAAMSARDRTLDAWKRLRVEWRQMDGPGAAWRFVRWLASVVLWRGLRRLRVVVRPFGRAAGAP